MDVASRLRDRWSGATALQSLGMIQHYRNIALLVAGRPCRKPKHTWRNRGLGAHWLTSRLLSPIG